MKGYVTTFHKYGPYVKFSGLGVVSLACGESANKSGRIGEKTWAVSGRRCCAESHLVTRQL